jgi:hypothetical protein
MGWSLGYDDIWQRWVGYGVPAYCDHPGCGAEIDRGLAYVCGGEPHGGDEGCGLFFCGQHILGIGTDQRCAPCRHGDAPFFPTPEHPTWVAHVCADPSWAEWRAAEPAAFADFLARAALDLITAPPRLP